MLGPVTFGLCAELSGREKREKSEEGKRGRSEIRTTKKKDLTRTHILRWRLCFQITLLQFKQPL